MNVACKCLEQFVKLILSTVYKKGIVKKFKNTFCDEGEQKLFTRS